MHLMSKADMAASKGTRAGFEAALDHLNKAASLLSNSILLKVEDSQINYINQKIELIKGLIAEIEPKEAAGESEAELQAKPEEDVGEPEAEPQKEPAEKPDSGDE